MSFLRGAVLAAGLLLAAGSAGRPDVPERVDGIEIVSRARAAELGLAPARVHLDFASGSDGGELVVRLLAVARENRARYVSDIEFELVVREDGALQTCSTRLMSESELAEIPAEKRSPLQPVERDVPHQRTVCLDTSRMVTKTEQVYESRWDYSCNCSQGHYVDQTVTVWEPSSSCHQVTDLVREVRYPFQFTAGFRPPRHERFAWASAEPLVDSQAACEPGGVLEPDAPYQIRALMYLEP